MFIGGACDPDLSLPTETLLSARLTTSDDQAISFCVFLARPPAAVLFPLEEYLKAHLLAVCRGTIFQANYFAISGVAKLISLHTSENEVSMAYYGSEAN